MQSFVMALRSISANKMRAVLTMLGIIIGVMALVVLVSLVNGATTSVTDKVAELGSSMVSVNILDDKGNSVVPCEMDGIDLMEEKCIILYRNGRSGFLTYSGKYIEPQFDEVEITYPCILAEKDGEQSFFDIDGEIIDERNYLKNIREFEEFKSFLLSLAKGDSNK